MIIHKYGTVTITEHYTLINDDWELEREEGDISRSAWIYAWATEQLDMEEIYVPLFLFQQDEEDDD